MNKFIIIVIIGFVFCSCSKEYLPTPSPAPVPLPDTSVTYFDLNNREIGFNQSAFFDLDKNGRPEFYFYSQHTADAISQRDYHQYLIGTSLYGFLQINNNEEVPVLQHGTKIDTAGLAGYTWFNIAEVLLAQKVITLYQEPYWEGILKNTSHKYIPLQLIWKGENHLGWVEVSFDVTGEKIIAHRAAVHKAPGKELFAGV